MFQVPMPRNRRNSEGFLPQGLLQGGKMAKKNQFTQMCGNISELMKSCRSRGQSRKPMLQERFISNFTTGQRHPMAVR
jgi:hypothetical protein